MKKTYMEIVTQEIRIDDTCGCHYVENHTSHKKKADVFICSINNQPNSRVIDIDLIKGRKGFFTLEPDMFIIKYEVEKQESI